MDSEQANKTFRKTLARMMATARALRLIASRPSTATTQPRYLLDAVHLRALSASAGAGDPAVHSRGPPSDDYTDHPPKFPGAEEATSDDKRASALPRPAEEPTKERVPPFAPSGKLGSQELSDATAGASFTQRRRWSSPAGGRNPLEDATPSEEEAAARKVREEDREYYRTHKPSPLAEVEFADTRRPITRATDGGAEDRITAASESSNGTMVEDTADASLARAEAMFREAAQRGNPAWPHSRALAAMLARRREGDTGGSAPWGS